MIWYLMILAFFDIVGNDRDDDDDNDDDDVIWWCGDDEIRMSQLEYIN